MRIGEANHERWPQKEGQAASDNTSDIEFMVARVTRENGFALVDGRVVKGTVRVHDIFTTICSHSGHRIGDRLEVVRGKANPVRLTVDSIAAYSHFLDFADSGLTARLQVRGDGLEELAAETILSL